MNSEIFRLYDIRGIYPQDLNQEMAYRIGRCFISFLKKKSKKKKLRIVVGRDIRFSSSILFEGFSRGITEEGCDIVDLGLIATPMLYFAVSHFKQDGGVIITASHSPNPWNGFKLTREKAIPLAGETGIFWLRDNLIKRKAENEKRVSIKGKIIKQNIEKEYIDSVLKLAKIKKGGLKGCSVVVDAGNGVGGPIALKVLKAAGIKTYSIFCKPDGNFPNHVPDPLLKENLRDAIALTKQKKPDLGIVLDGDADRIVFIDEKGKSISGDLTTTLMAKIILEENPRAKILYDIRSSNIAGETINKIGGKGIEFKVGHSLIKEKMRKDDILFGGELSGHYYWGQNLFFEVPFMVTLKILQKIKKEKIVLSELIKPYRKYYHSGEINFEIKEKEKKIAELKKQYQGGKVLELDGLRVDFKDWWFLVRPSNTEPVLRLILEAKNEEIFKKKKRELIGAIGCPILSKPLSYRVATK